MLDRNGWRARSLSVWYCWWGRRKALLTFPTDTAVVPPPPAAVPAPVGRIVVVAKVGATLASGTVWSDTAEHVDILVGLVAPGGELENLPAGEELGEDPLG